MFLNDPDLEAERRLERLGGKAREKFGQAKEKVSDALDDIMDEDED